MITVDDYLSTHGRHMDRLEWVSPAVERNAKILVRNVNALLLLSGFSGVRVSGGFRDMLSNRSVKGASPFSRHMTGEALDLADLHREIGKWALAHPEALVTCGLWAEPLSLTPTWLHVQTTPVPGGLRIAA